MLVLAISIGTLLRVAIAQLIAPGGMWGDEPAYLRNGVLWATTGQYVHFWPPGYSIFIGLCVQLFGPYSWGMIRLLQVAAAAWTIGCIYMIARREWGELAGRVAALGLAFYLPLAALTNSFYSETLYLAVLATGWYALQNALATRGRLVWFPVAGSMFGLLALFRDVGLLTWIGIVAGLAVRATRASRAPSAEERGRALIAALSVLAWGGLVLLPTSARNLDLRGRFTPSGGTTVANLEAGLGDANVNFELQILGADVDGEPEHLRRRLIDPPARSAPQKRIRTLGDAVARIADEPDYFVRKRIVRWADLMTPLNQAIVPWYSGIYRRDDDLSPIRRAMISFSIIEVCGLLLAGVLALRFVFTSPAIAVVSGSVTLVTLATGLLTAQSRFRAPLEVVLLVLVAGWTASSRRSRSAVECVGMVVGVLALLLAWYVAWPPLRRALEASW